MYDDREVDEVLADVSGALDGERGLELTLEAMRTVCLAIAARLEPAQFARASRAKRARAFALHLRVRMLLRSLGAEDRPSAKAITIRVESPFAN